MLDASGSEIEVVQLVEAPPEIVFSYLTDPARMALWIEGRAELDPRRLVLTWGMEGNASMPPGSTVVEITLTPERDGTVVRLRHLSLPNDTARRQHSDGWTVRLGRLAGLGQLAG